MTEDKVRCPACEGFGYHEDGSDEGRECLVCNGDGMATPKAVEEWKAERYFG